MPKPPTPPEARAGARRRIRALRWVLVAAWAAVIFAWSAVPGSSVPGRFGGLAHFVEYAVFSALLYFALRLDRTPRSAAMLAVAIASLYAVTDEYHQSFVPMRVPDPLDWLTDTVGAVAGALSAWGLDRRRTRRADVG